MKYILMFVLGMATILLIDTLKFERDSTVLTIKKTEVQAIFKRGWDKGYQAKDCVYSKDFMLEGGLARR